MPGFLGFRTPPVDTKIGRMSVPDESDMLRNIQKDLNHNYGPNSIAERSIHSDLSIQFYKNILRADNFCLEILRHGLSLPLRSGVVVQNYHEPNNSSCLKNLSFVSETVNKWLQAGKVKQVSEKPLVVNPLSVADKYDIVSGKIKQRLVIDMSRYFYDLICNKHVKLYSLEFSEPFIKKFDFMMSFDLKDMYHHVKFSSL